METCPPSASLGVHPDDLQRVSRDVDSRDVCGPVSCGAHRERRPAAELLAKPATSPSMVKRGTTGAAFTGLALCLAVTGCDGALGDGLADVEATVENCGAGGLSETIVQLENPNEVAVTALVDLGVYDDNGGEELVEVGVLRSVPANSTAEAKKNISGGVRASISARF